MKHENKRAISVEDLLRLKRAERPRGEFWEEFDRQLRAKQLAALVGRRPWWQDLSRIFSSFGRYHLPLGAATVLAVTFVSVRVNQPSVSATDAESAPAVVMSVPVPAAVSTPIRVESDAVGLVSAGSTAAEVLTQSQAQDIVSPTAVAAPNPGEFSRMIPLMGVALWQPEETGATRLPRFVDSALAATAAAEPVISRSRLSQSSPFETRTLPSRAAIEPLQQISTPSERRGSRILLAMVSMTTVENAMRTTERAASRLSEDQLYDQIHRFGARGAGVNVKF